MSEDTAILAQNLSKMFKLYTHPSDMFWEMVRGGMARYKPFWALRDISFEVKRGQAVGILGRNGAGKSTLLKIITGTLDETGGDLKINGRISSILELGTGFNLEYTGRDNIYIGGLMVGLSHEEIKEKEDWIIEFSELEDFIDQPFKTYSTGMQARLTFATAVCIDPDILIIDEALSVGDARFARKSFAKMEQFRKEGRTILLVSHDSNQVASFCDHAIILERGRVYDQGDPARLRGVYYDLLFGRGEKRQEIGTATIPYTARDSQPSPPSAVSAGPQPGEAEYSLNSSAFMPEHGHCWRVDLKDLPIEGDTAQCPQCSVYILCEDNRPLGPRHALHESIRNLGKGHFSHWGKQLFFSTGDNSDPRTNGHTYTLKHEDALEETNRPGESPERTALRQMALQKLGLNRPFSDVENSRATRYGNGKAELIDFGILDEQGKRVKRLVSGRKYTLFSSALIYDGIHAITPGFSICNISGMLLWGTNGLSQSKVVYDVQVGDLIETRAELTLWLTNGIYFLSMAIADAEVESNVQLDQRVDAYQFEIEYRSGIYTTSVVNLDETFSIQVSR